MSLSVPSPQPEEIDRGLVNLADDCYVQYQWLPNKGIQKAREELLVYTQDEKMIRRVLLASLYGRDEDIGLSNLLTLFG